MNRGQAAKYNFPKRTETANHQEELGDEPCRQRASANTHRISALKAVLVEDLDCAPLKRTVREHGRGLSQTRQATSKFALDESTSSFSRDEGQEQQIWPKSEQNQLQELRQRVFGRQPYQQSEKQREEETFNELAELPLPYRRQYMKRTATARQYQPQVGDEATRTIEIDSPIGVLDSNIRQTVMEKITLVPYQQPAPISPATIQPPPTEQPSQQIDIQTTKKFRIRSSRGGSLSRITAVEYTHSIFTFSGNTPKGSLLSEKLAHLKAISDQLSTQGALASLLQGYLQKYPEAPVQHLTNLNQHQTKIIRTHLFLQLCSIGCLVYYLCTGRTKSSNKQLSNLLTYTIRSCQHYSEMPQRPDIHLMCKIADNNGILTTFLLKLLRDHPQLHRYFKEALKGYCKQRNRQHSAVRQLSTILCNVVHAAHATQLFQRIQQPAVPYLEGNSQRITLLVNVDRLVVGAHRHSSGLPIRSHAVEFLRSLSLSFQLVTYSEHPVEDIDRLIGSFEDSAGTQLFAARLYSYHGIYNHQTRKYQLHSSTFGRNTDRVVVVAASPQIRRNLEVHSNSELKMVCVRPWDPKNASSTDNLLHEVAAYLKNTLLLGRHSHKIPSHQRGATL